MKETEKRQATLWLFVIMLILSIIGMIGFEKKFENGYHNLDLGQNIRYLNAQFNLNIGDLSSNNTIVTGTQLYINGLNDMRSSLIYLMIFSSTATISLCYIINEAFK